MNRQIIVWIILFCFNLHSMENTPLLPDQKNHYSKEHENEKVTAQNFSDEDLKLLIKRYSKTTCCQDFTYFSAVHMALGHGPDHQQYIIHAEWHAIKEKMIEDGITDSQLITSVHEKYMNHRRKITKRAIYFACGLAAVGGITIVIGALKPWQYF